MSEARNLQKPEGVKVIYRNCSQRCCGSSLNLNSEELEGLNVLRAQSRLQYNKENPSHQALLRQFWMIVFPTEILPENSKSAKWKEIGFQNTDPSSDFRGAGVFGLEQLLYLSTTYPQEFKDMILSSSSYSFAISALNITVKFTQHILMGFFQLHKHIAVGIPGCRTLDIEILKTFCSLNVQSLEIIHELYSAGVMKMHKTWMEMNKKGNLNLMQFQPAVLAGANFIVGVLETKPKSMLELRQKLFDN